MSFQSPAVLHTLNCGILGQKFFDIVVVETKLFKAGCVSVRIMKVNIPYYKQTKRLTCGPTSLRMVAAQFEKIIPPKRLKELMQQLESGMTFCEGIIVGAHKLGFAVKYFSTNLKMPDRRIPFFKKAIDKKAEKTFKILKKEIKKIGIEEKEQELSLRELLNKISKNTIPIVTLNTKMIDGKEGFNGHFVPVTGYDEKYVYVHNSGKRNAMPFYKIERKVFEKAWESKGSNRNTIVISKK